MEETKKKSFDFAADATKQLIVLSTAIITLTVTFSKDIMTSQSHSLKVLLTLTWIIYILSVLAGILTLMALTGALDGSRTLRENAEPYTSTEPSIYDNNIRIPSKVQIFSFLAALIMTVVFGCNSLMSSEKTNIHSTEYIIVRESKLGKDTTKYIDTIYAPK